MPFFTVSDGVRLYYEQWGDGELTAVFNPPWLTSVDLWAGYLRRLLRHDISVVLYDGRGGGRSDRPDPGRASYEVERRARDAVELTDELQLGSVISAGTFDGARAAVRFAAERPEQTVAAVLMAPVVNVPTQGAMYLAFREMLKAANFSTTARQLLEASSPGWTAEERDEVYQLVYDGSTNDIANAIWDAQVEVDDRTLLGRVACPALVIGGTQQVLPDRERLDEVKAQLPDVTVVEIEGSASAPPPGSGELTSVIVEWLRDEGLLPR